MENAKDYEQVLVTSNSPSIHFGTGDYFHIDRGGNEAWQHEVMTNACFLERHLAEQTTELLQIIPYILLVAEVCGNKKVFSYQRGHGGDERLTAKRSIGIGGHVNNLDGEVCWTTVRRGAVREVSEEITIPPSYAQQHLTLLGTVYTPTDDGDRSGWVGPLVGEVHLGVVYTIDVSPNIVPREKDQICKPKFVFAPRNIDKYERWSQLIINELSTVLDST